MLFREALLNNSKKKMFAFKGRTSRAEYWWIQAFLIIPLNSIGDIASVFVAMGSAAELIANIVIMVLAIVLLIVMLALGARRLHDINRSGWWQLIALTGIGLFVLLYWACKKGEAGDNKFGPPSLVQESKKSDWLVPFFIYIVFNVGFMARDVTAELSKQQANASAVSAAAPIVAPAVVAPSATVPAAPAPSVAPVAPVAAMDACEQRMADFAVVNKVDSQSYIAANQAYLAECRKTLPTAQPQQ